MYSCNYSSFKKLKTEAYEPRMLTTWRLCNYQGHFSLLFPSINKFTTTPLYISVGACENSKWVWSGNTTITHCRPTHGTVRKSHTTLTVTRHQEGNSSKATNSLLPIKMIAKLERYKVRNKKKTRTKHRTPTNNGNKHNQWINNNRTTALEYTAA